ncbi:GTP 3',8-cyclase MoaA [Draconibacterium halophilum]|uniref:GTP 3',8-cyclase n=1 Tax=Draconibacterium halophilum TaxID=2706887 RepID=A0A6C0RCZ8_9BACT|nr:GTP 3',8-cyclase MoaA [Draconibacterium halophilum]QIA07937.1 radical SAM protein [Draconibacterium halophilum]
MLKIEDKLGRRFEKLRISLLNSCNFSCIYCVDSEFDESANIEIDKNGTDKPISVEEFTQLIQAVHRLTGLKSVRLTGGEPLLYSNLYPLIENIKELGINDIRLTTNAFFLKENAEKLLNAGVKSINISVDAIDNKTFGKIIRRSDTSRVFQGIEAAINAGLNVKLNAVIMRGKNDSQIVPLLDYATELGVKIRYLELMKMGHLYHSENSLFFSEKEILSTIQDKYQIEEIKREHASTANYWRTSNGGVFGIIANESTPFCHDCNRLRLDSNGYFFGCLSNAHGEKLMPYIHNDKLLAEKLKGLLLLKQAVKFHGSELSMRNIGG